MKAGDTVRAQLSPLAQGSAQGGETPLSAWSAEEVCTWVASLGAAYQGYLQVRLRLMIRLCFNVLCELTNVARNYQPLAEGCLQAFGDNGVNGAVLASLSDSELSQFLGVRTLALLTAGCCVVNTRSS